MAGSKQRAVCCLCPITWTWARTWAPATGLGLGIAENSDAIAIVVSEETGIISMAKNGVLIRHFDRQTLYTRLVDEMIPKETAAEKTAAEGWKVRGRALLARVMQKDEGEQE